MTQSIAEKPMDNRSGASSMPNPSPITASFASWSISRSNQGVPIKIGKTSSPSSTPMGKTGEYSSFK